MAENTLGRNQVFAIKNADGTPFHDLVLHKATYDSVVMSLGDKITGDVYYMNNNLNVTMGEYIEFKRDPDNANEESVKFLLISPPTIIKEGIVSDNSELRGMTKYSFEFYHPMYKLGNMPLTDIAVTSSEEKYLSQNKTFFWCGTGNDFIAKLNANLYYSEWVVVASTNEQSAQRLAMMPSDVPTKKAGEQGKSNVLSFDKNTIADGLKTIYDTWDIPFVIDTLHQGEYYDANGNDYYSADGGNKRFVVVVGMPSNEIIDTESGAGVVVQATSLATGSIYYNPQPINAQKGKKIIVESLTDGATPIILNSSHNGVIGTEAKTFESDMTIYVGLYSKSGSVRYIYDGDEEDIFVFRYGQGVGLKNNSRTPRNNKIITRISASGSEDNVPYGYPQIQWTGSDDDPRLKYPLYKGIVGGQYVTLIKHPFTRTRLMPSVYVDCVNKKVNPNHPLYDPDIELVDYYDADNTYENPIVVSSPSYEIHEFDGIKPELDSNRQIAILGAIPLNNDLTPADSWVDNLKPDSDEYAQSYFRITLPPLGFDVYACASVTQQMQINMRSGDCIGCTFEIQVDWEDYKLNFYDSDGNFDPVIGNNHPRNAEKYPNSTTSPINVTVKKEISTFGTLMPNIYQQPHSGDSFVILGISLPTSYITDAQHRLDETAKQYMRENNIHYFDYPLKFDEYFLAKHPSILRQIRTNTIVRFDYAGQILNLCVKQITIKFGEKALPQHNITLTDNIEVVLNQISKIANDVSRISAMAYPNAKQASQGGGGNTGMIHKVITAPVEGQIPMLDSQAGSFTFEGDNLIDNHWDWVGLQVGSAKDKWQVTGVTTNGAATMMFRQNETGGTDSANWTDWATMLTDMNWKSYVVESRSYRIVTKNGEGVNNLWHRLGHYVSAGTSSNLVIEIFDGDGYNAEPRQNSFARIVIKDGWQSTSAAANSVGVTCERFGNIGPIKVGVVATSDTEGDVWVLLPWNYTNGDYHVTGRWTWTHNDSSDEDTDGTTLDADDNVIPLPVFNQRDTQYFDVLYKQELANTVPLNYYPQYGTYFNDMTYMHCTGVSGAVDANGNSQATVDIRLSWLQGLAMTEEYVIGLFTRKINDVDHCVCIAWDRKFNFVGCSPIDNYGCHANDATVCDGYLYIAICQGNTNPGVLKVGISELIANCENKEATEAEYIYVVDGGVSGIDYDDETGLFAVIGGGKIRLYDKNFTLKDTVINSDYRNAVYAKGVVGRITVQGCVYHDGVVECYDWYHQYPDPDSQGATTVVSTFDVTTKALKSVQMVVNSSWTEAEGVCKDPLTGKVWGAMPIHNYNQPSAFTVGYFATDRIAQDVAVKTVETQSHYNAHSGKAVYVDNSHDGYSNGSALMPYKSVGEALVMTIGRITRIEIDLKYTGTDYYCYLLKTSDFPMRILCSDVSNGKPTLVTSIYARHAALTLYNIKVKSDVTTDANGGYLYVIAQDTFSFVENCEFELDASHKTAVCFKAAGKVLFTNSKITVNGGDVNITNKTSSYRAIYREYGQAYVRLGGTLTIENMAFMVIYTKAMGVQLDVDGGLSSNLVLTNALFCLNNTNAGPLLTLPDATSVTEYNYYGTLAGLSSNNSVFRFFVRNTLTLTSQGVVYSVGPSEYYNKSGVLMSFMNSSLPVISTQSGQQLMPGDSVDAILKSGTYYCLSAANARQLNTGDSDVALPYTSGNFRLWHIVNTGTDDNASQWSAQMLLAPNEPKLFMRGHTSGGFTSWKEFAFTDYGYSKAESDARFVKVEFFNKLFQAFNGSSTVAANADSIVDGLKIKVGAWTEQYLSALGLNAAQGGGGGMDVTALWEELATPDVSKVIDASHLPAATRYSIGGVKVGDTLDISEGVLNLKSIRQSGGTYGNITVDVYGRVTGISNLSPQNIPDLPASKITSGKFDAALIPSLNYLPLSGSTMSNTNLVTNLNADLLDGLHAVRFTTSYRLQVTTEYTDGCWHRLGNYVTGANATSIVIELFSGAGWNANASQNSFARIVIKKGNQNSSATNSVGVTCERSGNAFAVQVAVVATEYNAGAVWVYFPWQYSNGSYTIGGMYTLWSHNENVDGTTTAPEHNQNDVKYFDTAYLTSNVASATKLQTVRKLWGRNFDGTADVSGNMTGVGTISATGNHTITKQAGGADISFDVRGSQKRLWFGIGAGNVNRGIYGSDLTWNDNSYTESNGKWMLRFDASNTALMHGNVGIGTTNPGYKLDVNGTGRFVSGVVSNSTMQSDGDLYMTNQNARILMDNDSVLELNGTSSALMVGYGTTAYSNFTTEIYGGRLDFCTGLTSRMYIDEYGCVGINTYYPQGYTLNVNGTTLLDGLVTANKNIEVLNNGSTASAYVKIGGRKITYDSTNGALFVDGNLYATGGISALGYMQITDAGLAGSLIPTTSNAYDIGSASKSLRKMYSNTVTVWEHLGVGGDAGNNYAMYVNVEDDEGDLLPCWFDCPVTVSSGLKMSTGTVGTAGSSSDTNGTIILTVNGGVKAKKFWLDGSRYLYLDGTTLKYYNGSQSKTISLS